MVLKGIPTSGLCLVAEREKEPGKEARKVLYRAIKLGGDQLQEREVEEWTYFVPAEVGCAVLDGLGYIRVEDELRCE